MNNVNRLTIGLVSGVALCFHHQVVLSQPQSQCVFNNNEIEGIARNISVQILTDDLTGRGAIGSGMMVNINTEVRSNEYYVITNQHVVEQQNASYFILPYRDDLDQPPNYEAEPLKPLFPPPDDLALLRFQASNLDDRIAVLGNSENLPNNQCVYLAGFPVDEDPPWKFSSAEMSPELINLVANEPGIPPYHNNSLTYSYEPNGGEKGMSGGPVLNSLGQVIGVHRLEFNENQSGLGVPIELIQEKFPDVFADLPKEPQTPSSGSPAPSPSSGSPAPSPSSGSPAPSPSSGSPGGANPVGVGVFSPPPSPTQPEPPSVIEPSPDNRPEEDLKKPTPGQW